MRTFVSALCIFLVIILLLTFQLFFITSRTDDLCETVHALPKPEELQSEIPPEQRAAMEQFHQALSDYARTVVYTVSYDQINFIIVTGTNLEAYFYAGNASEYAAARETLFLALHRIQEIEKILPENIL